MARNGERGEKAEEREMIEELLLPPTPPSPPTAFSLHSFLICCPTILEQTGLISFR